MSRHSPRCSPEQAPHRHTPPLPGRPPLTTSNEVCTRVACTQPELSELLVSIAAGPGRSETEPTARSYGLLRGRTISRPTPSHLGALARSTPTPQPTHTDILPQADRLTRGTGGLIDTSSNLAACRVARAHRARDVAARAHARGA